MRKVLAAASVTSTAAVAGAGTLAVERLKAVRQVMPAPRPHWVGDGFNVFPVFAGLAFSEELSPWLMFDYAAPKEFPKTRRRLGVGEHPHRGFETVTIAFQGVRFCELTQLHFPDHAS